LASKFTNFATQLVTQESPLAEGQTVHSTALDSNSHHSDKTNKEDKRTWPQIVHGQFLDYNKLDGQERCRHANVHDPPQEGNFHNEEDNVIKPKIVADYNYHLGYVDKGNRMANSYSISCQTWKWIKKAVFPSVQTSHSEQLHPSFFIWWEENFTQRFLTRPFA